MQGFIGGSRTAMGCDVRKLKEAMGDTEIIVFVRLIGLFANETQTFDEIGGGKVVIDEEWKGGRKRRKERGKT